jgi:NitT/TauT family transport system ATP-binding protein
MIGSDGTSDGATDTAVSRGAARTPVTIGFVPLIDAALLVVAREEGFAAAEGIDLALVREGSWAAIRDKLNVGLFDAAHMLAPAAAASILGVGHLKVPLVAPVALNLDGNAITVSPALARQLKERIANGPAAVTPATTAAALNHIMAERRASGQEQITIGVVFGFSCHFYQIRAWLKLGGIDPERDVRFVVIPPPLMVESLSAGLIDIFCAGAPWNRMAELAGAGAVLHTCSQIAPDSIEKLLVLRQDCERARWLPGLIRAIARAASWAGATENRPILARHLARPDYVGAPVAVIEDVLAGHTPLLFGPAATPWIRLDLEAASPSPERLRALFEMMRDAGHVPAGVEAWPALSELLRADLFAQAVAGGDGA